MTGKTPYWIALAIYILGSVFSYNCVNKANDLIKDDKIEKAGELYNKISEIYNELTPAKKQIYYNKVSIIYHDIPRMRVSMINSSIV